MANVFMQNIEIDPVEIWIKSENSCRELCGK